MTNQITIWKKFTWALQGAIAFGLGASLIVAWQNYEWNDHVLLLSLWQLVWILLAVIVGSGVVLTSNLNKKRLHRIFLKMTGPLIGIYLIGIGLKCIIDQHSVVKYLHFGGYEAVIQGCVFIVLGVAFGLYILLLKSTKNDDNESVHSDAPKGGA